MNKLFRHTLLFFCFVGLAAALFSCDGTKFLKDDELLLTGVKLESQDRSVNVSNMEAYVKQTPNTKWFSFLKVPLGIYSLAGTDTTKAINRRLRKWGEAPVVIDSAKIEESCRNITQAMQNEGYLDAEVVPRENVKKKRIDVTYNVIPNKTYTIKHLSYNIADHNIDSLLRNTSILSSGMTEGSMFSVNALHSKRNEITSWLNDNGYMYFNKEAITFRVDSSQTTHEVNVTMNIGLFRRSSREPLQDHPRYTINKVTYSTPDSTMFLKIRTLDINTTIREGDYYSTSNIQKTYSKFARIQAIRGTNIHFSEVNDSALIKDEEGRDRHLVDADVQLSPRKKHSVKIQPEGTNTAGDFGAALSVTYENRNAFKGGQVFSLQTRGAYEAIKGLEGYSDDNYFEFNFEGKLTFPEFVIPWISRDFQRRHNATSELVASYNLQNRPEFHRRVLTAGWKYKWQGTNGRIGYQYDVIGLNYVSMPWISDTFKSDYLESNTKANAILRYNYEDLFIMRMGFGITYTDNSNSVKLNIETAGNTLDAIANIFNVRTDDQGHYKVARVAFAQYAKFDADYTHLFKLDMRNTLALHARLGVAVPYGNSTILPFEKRYFAGGANSVRGWSVRELGPGKFRSSGDRIDFINHTGDLRIDLNAELRSKLFWKFYGAFFIDAGNIWTLRNYSDQPGGQFTLKSIYDEMAVAYGLGLRLNFDYFILRLDLGMKAINPDYTTSREHFPIAYPNFKRDYALHFAVGLPF